MKRKLALLLAAVMAVTAFPMTAMAASDNDITRKPIGADGKILAEKGSSTDVTGVQDAAEIRIVLKHDLEAGKTFKVELERENAKFYFRNNANDAAKATFAIRGDGDTLDTAPTADDPDGIKQIFERIGFDDPAATVSVDASTKEVTLTNFGSLATTNDDYTNTGATYNTTKGAYYSSSNTYVRFGNTASALGASDKYNDAPYFMEVGYGASYSADITVLDDLKAGDIILIPIVAKLTADADVYRVSVDRNYTTISDAKLVYAEKSSGKTKTAVRDTVTARTSFDLKTVIIKETKPGSIKKDTQFILEAPRGYEFDRNFIKKATAADPKDITSILGVDPGLKFAGASGKVTYVPYVSDQAPTGGVDGWTVKFDNASRDDYSTLVFTIKGLTATSNTTGSIYIDGLKLYADNDDVISEGDVSLSIKNGRIHDGSNWKTVEDYTEESFKVATASDYTVTLKTVKDDPVPTLVSGRYEGKVDANRTTDSIDDKYHKAAEVKFAEKIPAAWWAERTTKFELPKDVTILKAKFTKITNVKDKDGFNTSDNHYNHGKQVDGITINDNTLSFTNLNVTNNNKVASFQLQLWLGMDVNFEGDIDLKVSGSSIINNVERDKYPSVTIARAIKPIEVKVDKVSEVQVGYQYFTVSDFHITETEAGNLLRGKEVRVSITDGISIDMEIAKTFNTKRTAGDIMYSNVTTSSVLSTRTGASGKTAGQITFEIDRESKEASTISFTDVQVKVSRNVPYSNLSATEDRGIDLVVWGNAIAANYKELDENDEVTKNVNQRDLFTTPGISTKYIHVTTVATDTGSEFKNSVKVTIGNPVIKINDQDFTMPVAAYVSTASNSTMVPVRFIAEGLGLPNDVNKSAVKWDDSTKTVTVDAGSRIVQFQIGNTNYLVNGVSVPMVSPDGLPVAAEITNDRAFIPFRALGEAFNITVGWDAPTSTATYNAAEAK